MVDSIPMEIPSELPSVQEYPIEGLMITNPYTDQGKETEPANYTTEVVEAEVLVCPIHHIAEISPGGWEYYTCEEEECPMWFAAEDAKDIITEWHLQVKSGLKSYKCYCGEAFFSFTL